MASAPQSIGYPQTPGPDDGISSTKSFAAPPSRAVSRVDYAAAKVGAPRPEKYEHRERKQGNDVTNSFKKPQEIFSSAVGIGEYKAAMRWDKTVVLGFLAGAYIALAGCICIMFGGGVPTIKHDDPGLAKFLFACIFPFGIILVVIAGGELVTSNLAIMPSALLARRVTCKNWFFAYLGNFLGSLFVAALLVYVSGVANDAPWGDFLRAAVVKKTLGATWAQQVARGIGCNWLVCLGFWSALAAEDVIGKIWALWFPITAFVVIGFEHSVMNMFLIPAGMMMGADVSVGDFLGSNLIPVTIGNIFGGLLVAVPYWYVYWLPSHPVSLHLSRGVAGIAKTISMVAGRPRGKGAAGYGANATAINESVPRAVSMASSLKAAAATAGTAESATPHSVAAASPVQQKQAVTIRVPNPMMPAEAPADAAV